MTRRLAPATLLALLLTAAGCGAGAPPAEETHTPARSITEVLAAHTPELMKVPGVVGTAESRLGDGRPCISVMVASLTPELRARLPRQLEGWPVRIDVTGEFHAMPDSGR